MELVILLFLFVFATLYYLKKGDSLYKFIIDGANVVYDKYAPFSYKTIREKVKDLGQNYTVKDYTIQLCLFGGGAFIVSYLYFYSIIVSLVYVVAAISLIPYPKFCPNTASDTSFSPSATRISPVNALRSPPSKTEL